MVPSFPPANSHPYVLHHLLVPTYTYFPLSYEHLARISRSETLCKVHKHALLIGSELTARTAQVDNQASYFLSVCPIYKRPCPNQKVQLAIPCRSWLIIVRFDDRLWFFRDTRTPCRVSFTTDDRPISGRLPHWIGCLIQWTFYLANLEALKIIEGL